MTIVIINTFYYPDIVGGTEVSVQKLAEGLAEKKHKVHIICSSDIEETKCINGVRVHRFRHADRGKIIRNYEEFCNILFLKKIKSLLLKIKPDILNTNNLIPFSLAVWKLGKKLGIPVVHFARDYYLLSSRFCLKNRYYKYMSQIPDAVAAASEYTLHAHLDQKLFAHSKIKTVIPNAIPYNLDLYDELAGKKRKLQDEKITFAFVGRYTEDKGVRYLIEAFQEWNHSHAVLKLFGRGELSEYVKEHAVRNHNIRDYGFLYEEDLSRELQKCDVLIAPTASVFPEAFGRIVLDAYKHAMPVIATRVGGMQDIVIHKRTGLLIRPDSRRAIIRGMQYFSDRRHITSMLSDIRTELKTYGMESNVRAFENLYARLLK